ncbi:phage tail protein [Halomonas sp. BN3-1]|uniref:phage tail protein n=1 Tax=Halomonas sp. BN3-1 TaxID=2082393 RepID=UPI000D3878A8|nr:phage tail protein [Halomonas sp. BN3-1]
MPQFYTLLTDTGQAKIANAVALGTQIQITQMAVGDGGGNPVTPDSSATALANEVRRAPINAVHTDDDNPTWIVIEQVLPPDVGGWTIREVGVFDATGDLIAIGNLPETYKPVLAEGSSRTQTIRVVMEVSDTAAVTLKVDPSVVLATREYVDQQRLAHEQSRNHPAATETAQGMLEIANEAEALAGSDDARAMTPEKVHAAFGQFGVGALPKKLTTLLERIAPGTYIAYGAGHAQSTAGMPPGSGDAAYTVHAGRFSALSGQTFLIIENSNAAGSGSVFVGTRYSETGDSPYPLGWREIHHSGNFNPNNKADVSALTEHAESREHPAASETEQGMVRAATQDETNAGTVVGAFVSPEKLKSWASQWVKQATESASGMLKVATQSQVDAGSNDTTAVTPKKLRWGFSVALANNGYIALPSWLGGVIVQWGSRRALSGSSSYNVDTNFPIAFPNACRSVVVSSGLDTSNLDAVSNYRSNSEKVQMGTPTSTGFNAQMTLIDGYTADNRAFRWLAIGN